MRPEDDVEMPATVEFLSLQESIDARVADCPSGRYRYKPPCLVFSWSPIRYSVNRTRYGLALPGRKLVQV